MLDERLIAACQYRPSLPTTSKRTNACDRIRAIDEGRVTGVAYEDVMRAAESRLVP